MRVFVFAMLLSLAAVRAAAATLEVSQAEHDDWIYNVPAGVLECVDGALLFRTATASYALNRVAFERGHEPALALVDEQHLRDHQFAQYLGRWRQQFETGTASARRMYGPAMVDAATPRSLRDAGRRLCR